jgi:hypothetical protein
MDVLFGIGLIVLAVVEFVISLYGLRVYGRTVTTQTSPLTVFGYWYGLFFAVVLLLVGLNVVF